MSDELIKVTKAAGASEAPDAVQEFARNLATELARLIEKRDGVVVSFDDLEVETATKTVLFRDRPIAPMHGKMIDEVSFDDLQLAFSLATLRAADENATLLPGVAQDR